MTPTTLKITGFDLAASAPAIPRVEGAGLIKPGVDGTIVLDAGSAEVHGSRIKAQTTGGIRNLGYWDNFRDYASWPVEIAKPGKYEIIARTASVRTENEFAIEVGAQRITGKAPKTASWGDFVDVKAGTVEIKEPGRLILNIRPAGEAKNWKASNLASVVLKPEK